MRQLTCHLSYEWHAPILRGNKLAVKNALGNESAAAILGNVTRQGGAFGRFVVFVLRLNDLVLHEVLVDDRQPAFGVR